MISRTRPSTAGSVISSKSSRNSANGVGHVANASTSASGASLAGASLTSGASAWRRQARKRGTSLSVRSSVSQALSMPWAASAARACTIAVVLPKPAGARTSTSLTAPAWAMRWHTAARGTCHAVTLGGLSLDATRAVSAWVSCTRVACTRVVSTRVEFTRCRGNGSARERPRGRRRAASALPWGRRSRWGGPAFVTHEGAAAIVPVFCPSGRGAGLHRCRRWWRRRLAVAATAAAAVAEAAVTGRRLQRAPQSAGQSVS